MGEITLKERGDKEMIIFFHKHVVVWSANSFSMTENVKVLHKMHENISQVKGFLCSLLSYFFFSASLYHPDGF